MLDRAKLNEFQRKTPVLKKMNLKTPPYYTSILIRNFKYS
jgi:hypothetical protein